MKIAILGAGAFGTALGDVLVKNGALIEYYDPMISDKSLEDVLSGAEMIVLCVPSKVVSQLLPMLPHDIPLIIATKGLLDDKLFVDFNDYMVISGPGFAVDIKAAKPTKLTATDKRIVELFETDYLSFDMTDDRCGVLMCGSLKNVYAIRAGLMALERESDSWNDFIDEVVQEMKEVLAVNDAKAETVDLVCGVGDLKLTCGYPSRNYEFGDKLRLDENYKSEKTVEGLSALARIRDGEIVVPDNAVILKQLMEDSLKWA